MKVKDSLNIRISEAKDVIYTKSFNRLTFDLVIPL
jgi:hypothetical protein